MLRKAMSLILSVMICLMLPVGSMAADVPELTQEEETVFSAGVDLFACMINARYHFRSVFLTGIQDYQVPYVGKTLIWQADGVPCLIQVIGGTSVLDLLLSGEDDLKAGTGYVVFCSRLLDHTDNILTGEVDRDLAARVGTMSREESAALIAYEDDPEWYDLRSLCVLNAADQDACEREFLLPLDGKLPARGTLTLNGSGEASQNEDLISLLCALTKDGGLGYTDYAAGDDIAFAGYPSGIYGAVGEGSVLMAAHASDRELIVEFLNAADDVSQVLGRYASMLLALGMPAEKILICQIVSAGGENKLYMDGEEGDWGLAELVSAFFDQTTDLYQQRMELFPGDGQ